MLTGPEAENFNTSLPFYIHAGQITINGIIVYFLLKSYKVILMLKIQHRMMYKEYCDKHNIPFQDFETGRSD